MYLTRSGGCSFGILAEEPMEQFAGIEQMLGHERLRLGGVASADGVEQCGVFAVGLGFVRRQSELEPQIANGI